MVDRGDRRHSIGDHMTVARIYLMHAKDGLSAELEQELREVAELLSANIENSRGVEILRDVDDERRFMFIERWDSVEAHKAGAEAFLKLGIIKSLSALDRSPEGSYFVSLTLKYNAKKNGRASCRESVCQNV